MLRVAFICGGLHMIHPAARDLILNEEVGGETFYAARGSRPIWPGGTSGITIGIGYDLGYGTRAELRRDWGAVLDEDALTRLRKVVGIRGANADSLEERRRFLGYVDDLADVTVPWCQAVSVFTRTSLLQCLKATLAAFPGLERLPDLCQGAMVSLVYNRGAGLIGPNRVEMKNIRDLIAADCPAGVPDQIRGMKRLWPTLIGLQRRRDEEAALFEQGLALWPMAMA